MSTSRLLTLLLAGICAGAPLLADSMAPRLGAATNFGQSAQPGMLEASRSLPVTDFRDAVYWRDIETESGAYVFSGSRETWPDKLPGLGAGMSLTVNNGHPRWDGGHTPSSPAAVAAFANFAAAAVRRFPAINAVEVGNEMNSDTFVSGPGWDGGLETRARSYSVLLAETARAVRAARPGTRILGGAAHSVPLAWFRALFEAGAAEHMDALVIHPYGVEPEQLRGQIDALRQLPEAARMPIEVTEFGHEDPQRAPAYLLKSYCQMALAGVTRVVWYPLNPRGDGLTPLVESDGTLTEAGRAYRLAAAELAGREVSDAAPDPFTYGCRFGPRRALLWGEPRRISVAPGTRVFDAVGTALAPDGLHLSMEQPLLLVSDGQTPLAYTLGPQRIIADSLHQFSFDGTGDPFGHLVSGRGRENPLEVRPGQEKNGAPWVPYLGTSRDGVLRAGPGWVLPSRPASGPLDVVWRYRAPTRMRASLVVALAPSSRSTDGVDLTIRSGGRTLLRQRITGETRVGPLPVSLARRQALDVVVGPGESGRGDVTKLQVTLRRP